MLIWLKNKTKLLQIPSFISNHFLKIVEKRSRALFMYNIYIIFEILTLGY